MEQGNKISKAIKTLRRFLLLGLVLLCIGLVTREIHEKDKAKRDNLLKDEPQTIVEAWGAPVEKLAREMDMPIFFSIKDTFRKEALNENIIKKHFIYTELDPHLYPGDYIALKALHCNVGEDVNITCGVLTSKMYPILTSTNTRFCPEDETENPSIKTTLKGLINIYHENFNRFLRISKNFYLLSDIPSKYNIQELKEDMSKLTFMLDFDYHEKFKAAQLSESARLTFRNCTVVKYSPFHTRLKNFAYAEIVKELKKGKNLDFIERAFYARALAEYIMIFRQYENAYLIKDFANEIISCQQEDGSFLIKDTKGTLDNAFSLTLLSYTHAISGEEVYKESIYKFVDFLETSLKKQHGLPANFEKGGVSSAKGYVYLSRALLNSYITTFNPKSLKTLRQMLLRLNKNHKELNSMKLELSGESTLAKYINLCSVEDDALTSTNGVLLQIYCDMKTLGLDDKCEQKIKNIFNSTLDSPCSDIDFDFSLRLARHSNPIITMESLRKIQIKKAKTAKEDI